MGRGHNVESLPTRSDEPIVLIVSPNPEPNQIAVLLDCERPMVQSDAHGPEPARFLEVQRRMARVTLQQFIILIRQPLHLRWERIVACQKRALA